MPGYIRLADVAVADTAVGGLRHEEDDFKAIYSNIVTTAKDSVCLCQ